jgi:hypothetical protein
MDIFSVLAGLMVGALMAIIAVHAGKWWAVLLGVTWIASVYVGHLISDDLTGANLSELLVSSAAGFFLVSLWTRR